MQNNNKKIICPKQHVASGWVEIIFVDSVDVSCGINVTTTVMS